ncbi:diacylglycerol/lipid kinase family protein [Haloferula sargassicola]|uniref:Lipid kinase YegS n=1 Tax=Haloferula sargassicola TaxID=490096 RepID=A0ABP9UT26_9BACT
MSAPPPVRRFEVVLNRESGTLKDLWHDGLPDDLVAAFAEGGVEARIRAAVASELDATLDQAVSTRPDALIVGGGDGTVSHAASRLLGAEVPMGILPCGTFNLAARDLGVPLDPFDAARALATAEPRAIDVLAANGRTALCNLMLGFYPTMARRQEEFHGRAWWVKSARILRDLREAFYRTPPLLLKFESPEHGAIHRVTRFAAFVPGEYEDVLSVIPTRTHMDAGKIGIYVSKHKTVGALARGMAAYVFGLMKQEPELEQLHATKLTLTSQQRDRLPASIDGEILDISLPLHLDLKPRALRVLCPSASND